MGSVRTTKFRRGSQHQRRFHHRFHSLVEMAWVVLVDWVVECLPWVSGWAC